MMPSMKAPLSTEPFFLLAMKGRGPSSLMVLLPQGTVYAWKATLVFLAIKEKAACGHDWWGAGGVGEPHWAESWQGLQKLGLYLVSLVRRLATQIKASTGSQGSMGREYAVYACLWAGAIKTPHFPRGQMRARTRQPIRGLTSPSSL